jgi:hypothetical protein
MTNRHRTMSITWLQFISLLSTSQHVMHCHCVPSGNLSCYLAPRLIICASAFLVGPTSHHLTSSSRTSLPLPLFLNPLLCRYNRAFDHRHCPTAHSPFVRSLKNDSNVLQSAALFQNYAMQHCWNVLAFRRARMTRRHHHSWPWIASGGSGVHDGWCRYSGC